MTHRLLINRTLWNIVKDLVALPKPPPPKKRNRTYIAQHKRAELESCYLTENHPSDEKFLIIAEKTGLPLQTVIHWFNNRIEENLPAVQYVI